MSDEECDEERAKFEVGEDVKYLGIEGFAIGRVTHTKIGTKEPHKCRLYFVTFNCGTKMLISRHNKFLTKIKQTDSEALWNMFVNEPKCSYGEACVPGSGCCTRVP